MWCGNWIGRHSGRILAVIVGTAILLSICGDVEAARQKKTPAEHRSGGKSRNIFGVVYGDFMSADITLEDKKGLSATAEMNEDFGEGIGIFLDFPVYRSVWCGVSCDLIGLPFQFANGNALDISILAKYNILTRNKMFALRPAAGVGFAFASDVAAADGSVNEMTLRYYVEGVGFPMKGFGLVAQFGFLRGVSGGSSTTKVRIGSLPFLRIGVALGRLSI